MKEGVLRFVGIILIITACDTIKDCPACMTPPEPFVFELMDAETKENRFTNDTLTIEDFKIVNVLNQKEVDFSLIDENDLNYIWVNSIGWQTEIANCHFYYKEQLLFTFFVDAKVVKEDCCTFIRFSSIDLEGTEFELNQGNSRYRIYI